MRASNVRTPDSMFPIMVVYVSRKFIYGSDFTLYCIRECNGLFKDSYSSVLVRLPETTLLQSEEHRRSRPVSNTQQLGSPSGKYNVDRPIMSLQPMEKTSHYKCLPNMTENQSSIPSIEQDLSM
jgi:hypothetical protein